jgi:hypothetical protein
MSGDADARRQFAVAIEEILWRVWDPIGVNDAPEARNEYTTYVPGVQQLLQHQATDAEIMAHLIQIETERMGLLSSPSPRLHAVITALRAVDVPEPGGSINPA